MKEILKKQKKIWKKIFGASLKKFVKKKINLLKICQGESLRVISADIVESIFGKVAVVSPEKFFERILEEKSK